MELAVGQQFLIPSGIAQPYEQEFGHFSFVVTLVDIKIISASHWPANRDICFCVHHWPGAPDKGRLWFACYSIALGHDRYGVEAFNYSPDLINGSSMWYIPDLFRWEQKFLYLLRNGVVQMLP